MGQTAHAPKLPTKHLFEGTSRKIIICTATAHRFDLSFDDMH